ncbi:oxidoreductase-like domain-containing protein 1 [Oppia nitens]|uniref:oxidoreductase-like domain-containing protein 1 n=1 Tax=Oppia nitens TaxID=1686743 RepID=UPI0023DAB7A4|nr:oxidoreductase-like domain-containing protein 1 [Oppia nitens]
MSSLIKCKLIDNKVMIKIITDKLFVAKRFSNDSSDDKRKNVKTETTSEYKTSKRPPKPPENCCQSGCDNCVWVKYVEELQQYYGDISQEAIKQLDQYITDPSLKVFIKQQIKLNEDKDKDK